MRNSEISYEIDAWVPTNIKKTASFYDAISREKSATAWWVHT